MVRLRLYETLSLLPANSLETSYTHLLRMLVSEFTLTDNPANTTNSLLRDLCHAEDSIILGAWLEEMEHKNIEDQVGKISAQFHILLKLSHKITNTFLTQNTTLQFFLLYYYDE